MTIGFHGIHTETGLLIATVLIAIGLGLCMLSTKRHPRPLRMALLLLRAIVMALLCLVLFNPGTWTHPQTTDTGWWAILLDQSASMQVADVEGKTRWDTATRYTEKFIKFCQHPERLHVYRFAAHPTPVDIRHLSDVKPNGTETDLNQSIRELIQEKRRNLRGILILSDGRVTGPPLDHHLTALAQSFAVPIHALPLGGQITPPDLSIQIPQKHRIAFLDQPHPLTFVCKSQGLPPLKTDVVLEDRSSLIISNLPVELHTNDTITIETHVTPATAGFHSYRISIPNHPNEQRTDNNATMFGMTVLTNAVRILLAEGTPYWDSKFLARFLRSQPNLDVTAMYRISPERSLILMPDSEEPVVTHDPGFPDTLDQLAHYDLVIFGKNCQAFLNAERISLLKQAINNQGLGVIFARSKPYEGEFPELAEIEPMAWGNPIKTTFNFVPVSDAILFGDTLPSADSLVWSSFPPLQNAYEIHDIKTFTEILGHGVSPTGSRKPFPILLYRRYGKGIIMTLNAEGFWHWDFFPRDQYSRDMYQDIWAQLMLWVATHSTYLPGYDFSMKLSTLQSRTGRPIGIQVYARTTPSPTITPHIEISLSGKKIELITLTHDTANPNTWNGMFIPQEPGLYHIALTDSDKQIPQGISSTLYVPAPPSESANLSADQEALAQCCQATDGQLVSSENWKNVIQTLDTPEMIQTKGEAAWVPLWDRAPLLVVLTLLLSLDWFLRRRNGLL